MSGDDNSTSGIEITPQKAVNQLLSRFEAIGGNNSRPTSPKPPQLAHVHLSPTAAPPRPRTPSGSLHSRSTSSLLADSPPAVPAALDNARHLRTSSSSSDLNKPVKRAPPPPPARAAKAGLVSPLLLARPVPIPGALVVSHNRTMTESTISPGPPEEQPIISASSSYQSIRNMFSSPESGLAIEDPFTSPPALDPNVQGVSTPSVATIRNMKDEKPTVPPRRHAPPPPVSRCTSSGSSSLSALPSTSTSASSESGSDITSDSSDSLPPASSSSHRRHTSSTSSGSEAHSVLSAVSQTPKAPPRPSATLDVSPPSTGPVPPPLPTRRPTAPPEAAFSPTAPRLPCRPNVITSTITNSPEDSPVTPSDPMLKPIRPPPTRMIGLGDRLPPVRPTSPTLPVVGDYSSSEVEEDAAKDYTPDTSRSSRRPPLLFPAATAGFSGESAVVDPRIPLSNHTATVVIAAPYAVVSHGHHARVYILPSSSSNLLKSSSTPPVALDIDTRSFGLKEPPKITSAEFRYTTAPQDQGRILWLGTKEGHLVEVDIRTGKVCGMRLSAHPHPVTAIWHRGNFMVTADGHGKILVFDLYSPSPQEDVKLTQSHPPAKVVRIADKAEFLQLAGGLLWAACRSDTQSVGSSHRNTMIRVYDIFSPGVRVYTVLTKAPTGFPTYAAELDGGQIYLTHEEGSVSLWSVNLTTRDEPQFIDIVKCGMSDLTSCLGVCGKLWIGLRSGMINVYDVSNRPWVLTNSWFAHAKELPVARMHVDQTLGENLDSKYRRWGGLGVVSVGRDDIVRFWDGMLGGEWIETELLKREAEFSKLRNIKLLVVSWNCDSARPEDLHGSPANFTLLHDILTSVDSPDIISFGLQEVVDLESRKMAAKNVFMGGNKRQPNDGAMAAERGLDDTVTRAYKRWHDRFVAMVKLTMPPNCPYEVSHSESMIGLFTCILVKCKERVLLRDMSVNVVKRGMGGRYGNKGGILSRFVIEDTSICMINCHLAAGQSAVRQRNTDLARFLEKKDLFPVAHEQLAYAGGGDGTMVLDHEIVILNGDLNYRIDQRRDTAIALIQKGDFEAMLNHDQLRKEIKYNRGFRLRSFSEGPLKFAPTYKYNRRSNDFDSSEKKRCPAWCDRVLWRSMIPDRVKQLHYNRYEADVSDHRPISAAFEITVKSVRHEIRQTVKEQILLLWAEQQKKFLDAEKDFHLRMGIV